MADKKTGTKSETAAPKAAETKTEVKSGTGKVQSSEPDEPAKKDPDHIARMKTMSADFGKEPASKNVGQLKTASGG